MKKLLHLLIIAFTGYIPLSAKNEFIVLNQNMSVTEVQEKPYSITTVSHTKDQIVIDFTLNGLELSESPVTPGAKICHFPGIASVSSSGTPDLPCISIKYNIASTSAGIISFSNECYMDTCVVIGCGFDPTETTGIDTHEIVTVNPYNGFYPETTLVCTTIQNFKGIPIHYYSIEPVQYDYNNQILRIYKSFRATITFDNEIFDTEDGRSDVFKAQREKQLKGVIDILQPDKDNTFSVYPTERTQDYLIIANKYTYKIEDFVEWKKKMGYRTHLITEIPGNKNRYSWTWQELRDLIKEKYYELDNLTYVLLWGSPLAVPGMPFSAFAATNVTPLGRDSSNTYSYTAYSLLDGKEDLTPKFSVGRICALDSNQTKDAIQKIISYERNPITDPLFYSSAFLVGEFEPFGLNGTENAKKIKIWDTEDFGLIQWLERVRPILTDNGINAKRIYKRHNFMIEKNVYPLRWTTNTDYNIKHFGEYPTPTDYTIPTELQYPAFEWDGKKTDIQASLQSGSFLGIYYSHGNCNGRYGMQDFRAVDFKNGKCGNKSPLILSISCGTGLSDWNNSFANNLSVSTDGPIGMYASSDESYVLNNQYFLYGLTNAVFPDYSPNSKPSYFAGFEKSFKLGDIMLRGLKYCNDKVTMNHKINLAFKQHQVLTYTCFGDPSLDFNTEVPTQFNDPIISAFGPLIEVQL